MYLNSHIHISNNRNLDNNNRSNIRQEILKTNIITTDASPVSSSIFNSFLAYENCLFENYSILVIIVYLSQFRTHDGTKRAMTLNHGKNCLKMPHIL